MRYAQGNKARKITNDLMAKFASEQTNRRGITVDEHLVMKGSGGSIFALGDCTSTAYAPTAQVASQQGAYLARIFKQLAKRDALAAQLGEAQTLPETEVEKKSKVETLESQIAKVDKIRPFRYTHQGSLA